MLYIKSANYEDIEKEWLFQRGIPADENGFLNDYGGVIVYPEPSADILSFLPSNTTFFSVYTDCPEVYVPEFVTLLRILFVNSCPVAKFRQTAKTANAPIAMSKPLTDSMRLMIKYASSTAHSAAIT